LNKQKITIIGLSVALGLAGIFIVLDEFIETSQQLIIESYQNGYQQGMIDSISSLFEQTQNCQITPIYLGNSTLNVVDYECIKPQSENSFP